MATGKIEPYIMVLISSHDILMLECRMLFVSLPETKSEQEISERIYISIFMIMAVGFFIFPSINAAIGVFSIKCS